MMIDSRCFVTGLSVCVLVLLPLTVAVPLFSVDTKPEDDSSAVISTTGTYDQSNEVCVVGDVVYSVGDPLPPPEPCQRCLCAGNAGVACTLVQCPLRPGCRAVQRSDQCCPDYICECTFEGRSYDNGVRIPEAGSPCQVCYCRGGSVECAVLECFWRDDCEPRYEPGRCCPKFDHCPPPADSSHSARPMNSTEPKMAELTADSTVNLPVVTFKQVFPSTPETTTLPPVDTTILQEESTATVSEQHAASTPTQDGGAITESAVEAPSEPSSAPENILARVSDPGTTTQESNTEVTTEAQYQTSSSESTTEKVETTDSSIDFKPDEIPAASNTNTATDIPVELKIIPEETSSKIIQEEITTNVATDVPETTVAPETNTELSESRQDDSTETLTTEAIDIDNIEVTETPEVSKDVEMTTNEIGTTTEATYEAVASNNDEVSSNTDKPETSEPITETEAPVTEVGSTESNLQSHQGDNILDEIQEEKVSENIETSTQIQDVTEENPSTEEVLRTESPPEADSSNVELITETFDHVETTTQNLVDLVATETATDKTETEKVEEEEKDESSTEKLEENTTLKNEIESRSEPEVTTISAVTTPETKVTEPTEVNSSLISVLRDGLVPAVAIENETAISDLVKNISLNMSPANTDDKEKQLNNDKPSIIDELAKTIETADFPFKLVKNTEVNESTTTTESNEFELNESDFVDSDFGDSVEISPFPRPLAAPATASNDWRLAAVQDHSEDGLLSWRDEIDLPVDSGAADFLLLPWSEQHLRRRRASPVAQYVQNHHARRRN